MVTTGRVFLERGHGHIDYVGGWIGGNSKQRRRRCRQCMILPIGEETSSQ